MNDPLRYSIVIDWSDLDDAYVVTLPEWEGRVFNPVTHGNTYEEALRNGEEALTALVASFRGRNQPLPIPRGFVAAQPA